MAGEELFWTKVSAMGQVAGSVATCLAVWVSLRIASQSRRPLLRVVVGERLIIGDFEGDLRLLMFDVANQGQGPVSVRTIGWETGWLRRGPSFLKKKFAVQLVGGAYFGAEPPFEVPPGGSMSSYCQMENVLAHAAERASEPLFTRDWPWLGRRRTRIRAYVYTATGYTRYVRPERRLIEILAAAEISAIPAD